MNTARVADSYGVNPHEHKPSQDPWDAETADEKQAETGVAEWDGTSSSTSPSNSESSGEKILSDDERPAPNAESPSAPARKANSSARSTATNTKQ
jgi:hypothetical protein